MLYAEKTFGHELGLSCVFRQHRAAGHCSKLHGYALAFSFTFGCDYSDLNGWVVDFGEFGELRGWLREMFDHRLLAANDDPHLSYFRQMDKAGLVSLVVVEQTGCEAFARMAFEWASEWIDATTEGRAHLVRVTVREHGANAATFINEGGHL